MENPITIKEARRRLEEYCPRMLAIRWRGLSAIVENAYIEIAGKRARGAHNHIVSIVVRPLGTSAPLPAFNIACEIARLLNHNCYFTTRTGNGRSIAITPAGRKTLTTIPTCDIFNS